MSMSRVERGLLRLEVDALGRERFSLLRPLQLLVTGGEARATTVAAADELLIPIPDVQI